MKPLPGASRFRAAALTLASLTFAALALGGLLAGATAGAQSLAQVPGERHYDLACHTLQAAGFDKASVDIGWDAQGRAVFSWDGPAAQQLWVYDAETGALHWSVAYSPLSAWNSGEYDVFNALASPVTFGELPAQLDVADLDESTAARPLVEGRSYVVGLVTGCHIDPAAYPDGWYEVPASSSVGPRQAFVAQGGRGDI